MKRLLFFLTVVLLTSCIGAPTRPAELPRGDLHYLERYMDWYFASHMGKYDTPGVSVALVSDEKILWMKAYGYADAERGIRATTRSVYQVGSISKTFTAAAVMQQVERGVFKLDTPIQTYLPDFTMKSRWGGVPQPSLRELLSHHAGLPTYYLKGFFSHQPLGELVQALKDEHLAYPPRQIFNYSNLGPDIAGAALERSAGVNFATHMQRALLDPLGMRGSSFALDERVRPEFARGYVKKIASDAVTLRDVPAGGLFSNVEDLARFMRMMLSKGTLDGRRVLSETSVAAMFTPQFDELPLNFGQQFGLGWMLSGIPIRNAGPVVWHNGGTKTFLSQMVLLPEKKLGVVVLANADRAGAMVYEAAEEILRLALEAREGITQPPAMPRAPQIALTPEQLDRYAGDYSLMGALARIERNGDRLRFHILGHTLELVPVTQKDFRVEYRVLGLFAVPIPFAPIEFTEVDRRMIMLMRDRGVAITAEKVPSYSVSEAWRLRAGNYRIVNPDKEYLVDVEHCRLTVEDGKILMNIRISGLEDREVKVVLMPLGDDSAYTFGIGRNVGDVTVVERHDGRERMRFLGYYFEREEPISITQR
ncbi:MAG TPA: serine hydrolase domain-containing protein [Burkholderiales bacterium]|nr:serine hydrolase domain-containing protein [Burkholderiales bacterium]